MFESLLKAEVGVVIETPLAIATDIVTMGGALTAPTSAFNKLSNILVLH